MERLEHIKANLQELKSLDKQFAVFGSTRHRYQWQPRLTALSIDSIEKKKDIVFTSEYKALLIQLGNGGPGPGYGLEALNLKHITPGYPGTDHLLRNWKGEEPDIEMVDLDEVTGYVRLFNYGCGRETSLICNGLEKGALIFYDCDEYFYKMQHSSILTLYEKWLDDELSTIKRVKQKIRAFSLQETIDSEWELENFNVKNLILSLIDVPLITGGYTGAQQQKHLEEAFSKWQAAR